MPLTDAQNEIENLVSERRTRQALTLINKYLKKNRKYTEERIRIANWYWRLGVRSLALSVLEGELNSQIDLDTPAGEEQLWLCRILNSLGSSRYTLRIISRIDINKIPPKHLFTVGSIYLSNYLYSEPLPLFERAIETHPSVGSDTYNFVCISKADALAGLEKFSAAISIVEKINNQSSSPLLKFISASAWAEYLIKAGEYKEALKLLEPYQIKIKEEDKSTDAGFFYKWLGAALMLDRQFDKGFSSLKKAWEILYKPRNKPEGWMEVLYWIGYGKYLQKDGIIPREWLQLISYPHLNFFYAKNIYENLNSLAISVHNEKWENKSYKELIVSKDTHIIDEISDLEHINNKKILNLSLIQKMVALLSRAGKYQISRNRLIETLWPNELFSASALDLRLKNLIFEGRALGYKIECDDGSMSIRQSFENPKVIFYPNLSIRGFLFLLEQQDSNFKRLDVEKYFNISKKYALQLLKDWKDRKLVLESQNSVSCYRCTKEVSSFYNRP